jgi:hypothetical protein
MRPEYAITCTGSPSEQNQPRGDERVSFIEGCPGQWAALPRPEPPLTVGIDGCYVRQWEDKKAHFEVIVGKSMSED